MFGLPRRAIPATLLVLLLALLTAGPAAATDFDGDGVDAGDCAPLDPAVFPGAVDRPDLAFEDANCDGVDGDVTKAVFVSLAGNDANTGTLALPFLTIQKGIDTAAGAGKSVYVFGGTYSENVELATGVSVYGGYTPSGARSMQDATTISGAVGSTTVYADGATGVELQLLTITGGTPVGPGISSYAVRAVNGSSLALTSVTATGGPAETGTTGGPGSGGTTGTAGVCGGRTTVNNKLQCPSTFFFSATGGPGGEGAVANRKGGDGGDGQGNANGEAGGNGQGPKQGTFGAGGTGTSLNGNVLCQIVVGGTSCTGKKGGDATGPGDAGTPGTGAAAGTADAGATWLNSAGGTSGTTGDAGSGGGGGGSGRGVHDDGCNQDISGGAGGGGGGGGGAGGGGKTGGNGGGSFGVYLHDSTVVIDGGAIAGGAGGTGGKGGAGGTGGSGGGGGSGDSGHSSLALNCDGDQSFSGGAGGVGGKGGQGGGGGGGAGGPSFGIFAANTAGFQVHANATTAAGTPGAGGAPGAGGTAGPSNTGATGPAGATFGQPTANQSIADFDGDGTLDDTDACPAVPASGGCPARPPKLADTDGDNLPDSADQCPTTAGGPLDANGDGCPDIAPVVDNDKDGFPVGQGDCDDTNAAINVTAKEVPGNAVDENCDSVAAPFPKLNPSVKTAGASGNKTTAFTRLKVVDVPSGAKVEVRCKGSKKACPFSKKTLKVSGGTADAVKQLLSKKKRKKGFVFKRGATVEVRITAPDAIGKVVQYKIVKRKFPSGKTLCLPPGTSAPTKC